MSDTGVRNGTGPRGLIIGTAGWSYDSWAGAFYPAGTTARDYLAEYSRVFRAVEIDSTFYAMPRADYVRRWAQVTPDDFVFCPKMVQTVTHEKQLVGCQAETQAFLDRMSMLGDKLGPVVLQFHYQFKPDRMGVLATYLGSLPEGCRFAVEVRNRGWLADEFYEVLNEHRTALVLSDLHYMPRLDVVTTDFVYVRWLGRRADVPSDFSRVVRNRDRELEWWAEKVQGWLERGLTVYAFANNRYMGHGPATVRLFTEKLSERMTRAGRSASVESGGI